MITGLAHICFGVSNLEESIAFYKDKLGLSPAFDYINDKGERFGIYLHIGGRNFIELFKGNPEQLDQKQSYKHFCLEVDDIQSTVSEIRKQGEKYPKLKWVVTIAGRHGYQTRTVIVSSCINIHQIVNRTSVLNKRI